VAENALSIMAASSCIHGAKATRSLAFSLAFFPTSGTKPEHGMGHNADITRRDISAAGGVAEGLGEKTPGPKQHNTS